MSVVAAQNRRALLSYTLGEIKTLLAELLGLGQIRQPGDKASQIVRLIRTAPDERRRSRAEACGMGRYGAASRAERSTASASACSCR